MELHQLVPFTKFGHIAAMFIAASVTVGGDLLFLRIASDGNAATTARLGHAIRRRGPLTKYIYEIGILFGLITALLGGFNLLAPWLIGAYLVIAALVYVSGWIAAPAYTKILEVAGTGDDEAVKQTLASTRYPRAAQVTTLLFLLAVFLMVVKPFA